MPHARFRGETVERSHAGRVLPASSHSYHPGNRCQREVEHAGGVLDLMP